MTSPPTWALFDVDLAHTDEEELAALLDEVIDSGRSLSFRDTRESEDIKAVVISWEAYVGLMSRAHLVDQLADTLSPTEEKTDDDTAH